MNLDNVNSVESFDKIKAIIKLMIQKSPSGRNALKFEQISSEIKKKQKWIVKHLEHVEIWLSDRAKKAVT